jgi:hypothetical protein
MDLRKPNNTCLHDPFPTPFIDEVLENVGGQETYSFTDGFSGYHQIKIAQEDRHKTTFATEWGSYQYTVMPFGLKNALAVFSRVVVASFKEFIHKFLEVYLDDWIGVQSTAGSYRSTLAHVRSMQTVSDFPELEEMYVFHTIWNSTRTCSMQTRTIG